MQQHQKFEAFHRNSEIHFLLHLYLGNRLIGYHIKLKINNGFRCAATELRNKVEDIRVCQWLSLSSEEDS